jgi:ribonuclease P protein subunit POP4
MKFSQNILRHELVGLNLEIVNSTDKRLISTKGRVINETRNMLVIEKNNGKEITVPKEISIFRFEFSDLDTPKKVDIDGRLLIGRPEDRIKSKIKQLYPY